jgi:hypothetical protein
MASCVGIAIAAGAFVLGSIGALRAVATRAYVRGYIVAAVMMIVFFQAARLAMVRFDPLLSSRNLARLILQGPPGQLIVDHNYYWFSSVPFYTGPSELLLNGRMNNLEYGSNAPGVPDVFIDDSQLGALWSQAQRCHLIAKSDQIGRFNKLLGQGGVEVLGTSGGKVLLTNRLGL